MVTLRIVVEAIEMMHMIDTTRRAIAGLTKRYNFIQLL